MLDLETFESMLSWVIGTTAKSGSSFVSTGLGAISKTAYCVCWSFLAETVGVPPVCMRIGLQDSMCRLLLTLFMSVEEPPMAASSLCLKGMLLLL